MSFLERRPTGKFFSTDLVRAISSPTLTSKLRRLEDASREKIPAMELKGKVNALIKRKVEEVGFSSQMDFLRSEIRS